jgi:WD40 repeat protein
MATLAQYDLGEHVECVAFIEDEAFFAVADGKVHFPALNKGVEAHESLLCATPERGGKAMLTGGEDGRVLRVTTEGWKQLAEVPGKWIDVIASGPNGAVAVAAGRSVFLIVDGQPRQFDHARAVEGLAFMPKGLRLACARYNGVTLHWGATQSPPHELQWEGVHIGVLPSPDGRYIITAMAENALHGWRLDARKAQDSHMRMSGYPAKPKSLSWSAKGKWLASSGAQAAICWPFTAREGPQGKAPRELGTRKDSMVVEVCCHPVADVVAIGYADGMVIVVRIDNGVENLLRSSGQAPVSALAWDDKGNRLAFGTEAGEAGVVTL